MLGHAAGEVTWWNLDTGAKLAERKGHRIAVVDLAFSPDGSTLASASADGTVALWDVPKRKRIAYWKPHSVASWAVAFSPDGSRLVTGHGNEQAEAVRLWDQRRGGNCRRSLPRWRMSGFGMCSFLPTETSCSAPAPPSGITAFATFGACPLWPNWTPNTAARTESL